MEAIEWHGCTEQLLMSRKSKLEVEKNVLLQFSKFEMADVLANRLYFGDRFVEHLIREVAHVVESCSNLGS